MEICEVWLGAIAKMERGNFFREIVGVRERVSASEKERVERERERE